MQNIKQIERGKVMRKLKVAIIGTGIIASSHLSAIKNTGVCELCAVCDINEEKAKALSEEYQVPYFLDYHEIPGKIDVDAVILNLPHYLHCESSVFFLEHGVHVLVEKPMANSVEECEKMIAAAERNNRKLAVGHVQRYYKANAYVKETIADGRLGKLCMITGVRSINYFLDSRPRWFLNKKLSGGGIGMNYGAHALDTLFYITDETEGEITSNYGNLANEHDIEGHVQFMIKLPNGVSMCETLTGYQNCGHELIYYFTGGVLKIAGAKNIYELVEDKWLPVDIGEEKPAMECQLIDFCNYLEDKPGMICEPECGRAVIAALEKVYRK